MQSASKKDTTISNLNLIAVEIAIHCMFNKTEATSMQ